jgi:hypothetical protein
MDFTYVATRHIGKVVIFRSWLESKVEGVKLKVDAEKA